MFEWLKNVDRDVLLWINGTHHPWADQLMWFFSWSWPTYLLVLIGAYGFYRRYNLRKAAEFVIGCAMVVAVTDLTTNVVKHNVKRLRPTHNTQIGQQVRTVNAYKGGQYGFYSAHAANTFAVITYLFLGLKFLDRQWRILLFVYPLLVMYSRVYLGVHYPSDVITGMLFGLITGALGFRLVNTYFMKRDEASG